MSKEIYIYIFISEIAKIKYSKRMIRPPLAVLALTNFQSDHCIVVLIRFNVCHRGDLINRMRRFETSDNALNNDETCLRNVQSIKYSGMYIRILEI